MKKKVSVLIPCYNEEENVVPMSNAIKDMFEKNLPQYDYELLFIDNDSSDNTRPLLREICARNKHVKAIFNAKNFGQFNSPYHGMLQTIGIKTASKENKLMYALRSMYYSFVKKFSDVEQIQHFTGSGLYDREFIEVLRNLNDPTPFLRGIVAELGFARKEIEYEQPKRRAGKTHNNFYTLYDAAMLSITSYTKIGLRLCTFLGAFIGFISIVVGIVYLVLKLTNWYGFEAGMAPMIIIMSFMGAIQLFSIGFMGEYIMSMNKRIMNRPLVVEEERINFEEK